MKKCIILIVVLCCTISNCFSQTKFNNIIDFSDLYTVIPKKGGSYITNCLVEDSSFIISGVFLKYNISTAATFLAKYDYNGVKIWDKELLYPGFMNFALEHRSVIKYENKYALAGIGVDAAGKRNMFLYLFTRDGDSILYVKYIDTTKSVTVSTIKYNQGYFYIFGHYQTLTDTGAMDSTAHMVIKMDTNGVVVKTAILNKRNFYQWYGGMSGHPATLLICSDKSILVAGNDYFTSSGITVNYVTKLDSNLNILWTKHYQWGYFAYPNMDIMSAANDGFYFMTNYSYIPTVNWDDGPKSSKIRYGRCNSDGDTLWMKDFADSGLVQGFRWTESVSLGRRANGDMLLLGYEYFNSVNHPMFLIADSNGTVKSRRYFYYKDPEAFIENKVYNIYETPFKNLLVIGAVAANTPLPPTWDSFGMYGWMVQTDSFGCLVPGCQSADTYWVTTAITPINNVPKLLEVYPNPVQALLHLDNGSAIGARFTLSDADGKIITNGILPRGKNTLDCSGLSPGVYFINILWDDGSREVRKALRE